MRPIAALRSSLLVMTLFGAAGAVQAEGALLRRPVVVAQLDDDPGGPIDQQPGTAAMGVRLDRMENTIRSLTGQIEQLQFQNRKLSDDLRKMQEDVDFRFQDLGRGAAGAAPKSPTAPVQKRSDLDVPVNGTGAPMDASGTEPAATPSRPVRKVGDAFDPASDPAAPGAPRPLGSTPPSPALGTRPVTGAGTTSNAAPSAPLDLMKRPATADRGNEQSTENGVAAVIPSTAPAAGDTPVPLRPAPNPNAVASLAPGGTRDEFNAGADLYKQGQYDGAAAGLRSFLDKYPRDRLVPDAVYMLGQSYTRLGRHREAAEQYLRLSTDFSKAPRAPDALLRLGMSLDAMGVREQACATYQEVTRRYPAASPDVRTGVDRELKRARC